ncbi:MAG: hypothetical protein HY508_04300 [Acidobacteria bacterium]|nr:hypothetical protein [Acidobacteriota bacterium]
MRIDIGQETDPGDPVLEIPWADPDNPANLYIDVKRRPEAAMELVECRRFPALGQFLLKVNSAAMPFRTAKCDAWATSDLDLEERIAFGLPHKVGSYVDLLIDRADMNSHVEPYQKMGALLAQRLKDSKAFAQIEIFIRRCLFTLEDRSGYYATVFIHAYGANAQEAESEWNGVVEALGDSLDAVSREFGWGGTRSSQLDS